MYVLGKYISYCSRFDYLLVEFCNIIHIKLFFKNNEIWQMSHSMANVLKKCYG